MAKRRSFWSRVDKYTVSHSSLGNCWVWMGTLDEYGYGIVTINGRKWRTHRYSWVSTFGDTEGLCVLHKCDNPRCVNPNHLFLGTRIDNNLDRDTKGRLGDRRGMLNGRAKVDEATVKLIRGSYQKGVVGRGQVALARRFGLSPSAIRFILIRKNWKHI